MIHGVLVEGEDCSSDGKVIRVADVYINLHMTSILGRRLLPYLPTLLPYLLLPSGVGLQARRALRRSRRWKASLLVVFMPESGRPGRPSIACSSQLQASKIYFLHVHLLLASAAVFCVYLQIPRSPLYLPCGARVPVVPPRLLQHASIPDSPLVSQSQSRQEHPRFKMR